ncbi:RHS repeat-associated core domain-containing protein [Pseudanabaena sp. UWO310]|uniref:RHS repeat-associated core domain-containing protein n=1 Tax=Pseudanabaena sp. UWO310 TaxID=2480795 RepID=UPI001681BC20|nr:RHS repeat-associated core domain-containing protein [Pseudanabaena sp. UWO310]
METRYLIDANRPYAQVLEEYNSDGSQVSFVYGNNLISQNRNGNKSFYLGDGHSGVRQLANSSGVITDTYNYDAYGTLLRSTGNTPNSYLYRGEQFDSNIGDYYLRARYYNPNLGRFNSVDPFEGNSMNPMSRHRFIYGNDNPISFQDPSGNSAISILDISVANSMLDSLLAASGLVSAFQLTSALTLRKDIDWSGKLTLGILPPAVTKYLGGINLAGGILSAKTVDEVPSFSGNWLIVGLGIGIANAGIGGYTVINADASIESPSIIGAGPQTFALNFLLGGTLVSGGGVSAVNGGFIAGWGVGAYYKQSPTSATPPTPIWGGGLASGVSIYWPSLLLPPS